MRTRSASSRCTHGMASISSAVSWSTADGMLPCIQCLPACQTCYALSHACSCTWPQVVYDMSKDSAHFKNEQRKQAQVEEKVAAMRAKAARITAAELAAHQRCVGLGFWGGRQGTKALAMVCGLLVLLGPRPWRQSATWSAQAAFVRSHCLPMLPLPPPLLPLALALLVLRLRCSRCITPTLGVFHCCAAGRWIRRWQRCLRGLITAAPGFM